MKYRTEATRRQSGFFWVSIDRSTPDSRHPVAPQKGLGRLVLFSGGGLWRPVADTMHPALAKTPAYKCKFGVSVPKKIKKGDDG